MSESLRALVAQANEINQQVMEGDGVLTPELEAMLSEIELKLPQKIDAYAVIMERSEIEEAYWKEKARQCSEMAKRYSGVRSRLKDNIKFAMEQLGMSEAVGNEVRFKLTRSKPQLVINEDFLDSKYLVETIVKSVDKKAIEADLKEGKEVEGATLMEVFALRSYAAVKELK